MSSPTLWIVSNGSKNKLLSLPYNASVFLNHLLLVCLPLKCCKKLRIWEFNVWVAKTVREWKKRAPWSLSDHFVVTKGRVVYSDVLLQLWSWGLVLNIKEETQSSEYDHRILWQLTSAREEGNKKRPQSYWLRQQSAVCLCWTLHFTARNDVPKKKNHLWPTWRVSCHPSVQDSSLAHIKQAVWSLFHRTIIQFLQSLNNCLN